MRFYFDVLNSSTFGLDERNDEIFYKIIDYLNKEMVNEEDVVLLKIYDGKKACDARGTNGIGLYAGWKALIERMGSPSEEQIIGIRVGRKRDSGNETYWYDLVECPLKTFLKYYNRPTTFKKCLPDQ